MPIYVIFFLKLQKEYIRKKRRFISDEKLFCFPPYRGMSHIVKHDGTKFSKICRGQEVRMYQDVIQKV